MERKFERNIEFVFVLWPSDDTYIKALPAQVAVDHNQKRFDNECSG